MNVVLFCHSLRSDWNHGNAHFLRGVVTELEQRGHAVRVLEPADSWSARNLQVDAGPAALEEYRACYPALRIETYAAGGPDLERALDGAQLVLVHEWSAPELVAAVGAHRARHGGYRLLFHDTHHRLLSAPQELEALDLSGYDGVLAFGEVLRERYAALGWGQRAYTWHEAADTRVFYPRCPDGGDDGQVVWVGNFGDDERRRELGEFLVQPVRALQLAASVYGVRYPDDVRAELAAAGIEYRGWLPNYRVPDIFARFAVTVHVPRRPYALALPGIPTIRPFEALACGIPLLSAPWRDCEGLFTPGQDFLMAQDGQQMTKLLFELTHDDALRTSLAHHGLKAIQARHTCAHRVDELLAIARGLDVASAPAPGATPVTPEPTQCPHPSYP